jgi:hypothetical protein
VWLQPSAIRRAWLSARGHCDWFVHTEEDGVLRRERTRGAAMGWARAYGKPCAVSPQDLAPQLMEQAPLFPRPESPHAFVPRT